MESSDDAIVSKNLDGIITSWNNGAERIFGYTAEEAVGQSITIIIPQDRQDEERTILTRIRRGERIEHFETVRQRKNGTGARPFEKKIVGVTDPRPRDELIDKSAIFPGE